MEARHGMSRNLDASIPILGVQSVSKDLALVYVGMTGASIIFYLLQAPQGLGSFMLCLFPRIELVLTPPGTLWLS
jgi:hypothetical protein